METEASPPPLQTIVFHHRLGGFIGVAVVNLLLSIVTFGIYRFWARARVRRFLWENTTFVGEPLEYRGKGVELLVGAILGFTIILTPYGLVQVIAAVLVATGHPIVAGLLIFIMLVAMYYLVGVGLYRSVRYMVSRTSWRGIRGGMSNGGWSYGWLYIRLQLLRVVTLGFASPYVSTSLWNARMNDAMFGSAHVRANASWRPLFGRFVISLIASLVIYGIAVALIVGPFRDFMAITKAATPGEKPDPQVVVALMGQLYGTFIVAGLLIGVIMLSYHAAYWRNVFANTRLDTLGFEFSASMGSWLGYYLINFLIIVFTLGFGLMVMPWRAWSFYTGHLRTVGSLDTDALLQTQLAAPVQGDGIADAIGFSVMPF